MKKNKFLRKCKENRQKLVSKICQLAKTTEKNNIFFIHRLLGLEQLQQMYDKFDPKEKRVKKLLRNVLIIELHKKSKLPVKNIAE